MNLMLSATVIHYAMAGPMERLLLAPAASGAVAGDNEILLPPMNQVGRPKHPTTMGAACLA